MFIPHYVSCVMCPVSRVMCHLSCVTCYVSRVTCHLSHVIFFIIIFFWQSGGSSRRRVCYQRGLPRLVIIQASLTAEYYTILYHYPSFFHSRILYYTIFTIQVPFLAEYCMLVTGDSRVSKTCGRVVVRPRKFFWPCAKSWDFHAQAKNLCILTFFAFFFFMFHTY